MKLKKTFLHCLSFAAGFLVRPCCVIPAAVALLGLSGAGIAAVLVPLRPWFLLTAAVFFTVSFYWNFVRNKNRAGMVVWGLSVVLAGLILVGPEAVAALQATFDTKENSMNTLENGLSTEQLTVDGMACNACARRLERVLADEPGVKSATVDFPAKQVRVGFDPATTDRAAIAARIEKAGFAARSDSSSQPATKETR